MAVGDGSTAYQFTRVFRAVPNAVEAGIFAPGLEVIPNTPRARRTRRREKLSEGLGHLLREVSNNYPRTSTTRAFSPTSPRPVPRGDGPNPNYLSCVAAVAISLR